MSANLWGHVGSSGSHLQVSQVVPKATYLPGCGGSCPCDTFAQFSSFAAFSFFDALSAGTHTVRLPGLEFHSDLLLYKHPADFP